MNVDKSLECTYQVYQNENETELLAEEKIYRDFVKSGVQRISIKTGKIRGTLFLPPGNGPYPAVINIYGGLNKVRIFCEGHKNLEKIFHFFRNTYVQKLIYILCGAQTFCARANHDLYLENSVFVPTQNVLERN